MTTVEPNYIGRLFGDPIMAGLIGSMNAFDASEETWGSYVERLEIFLEI